MNSKESKILRDMASIKKQISDTGFRILDRKRDAEKMNIKLAQSMSLTSAHGLRFFIVTSICDNSKNNFYFRSII